MLSKDTYAIQPYYVGSRDRKSLAIILPAKVTKECKINPSTIFAIQVNKHRRNIVLQVINAPYQEMVSAGDSFGPSQQTSEELQQEETS
jgi:hypothetical protein